MVRPVSDKHKVTLGYRQKPSDPKLKNYIHRGVDYGCPIGTPVVATTAGVVVHAREGGGYGSAFGIHVIVRTGDVWHLYAHLSDAQVDVGDHVQAGQQLGLSGATGNVTGPHLHYAEFTEPPPAYKSDRMPKFIAAQAGPVDRMEPANYFVGAHGDHVLWFGQRLVAHGARDYTPTRDYTNADVRECAAFQRRQTTNGRFWTGADANGLPGRETLRRLAAEPLPPARLPADVLPLDRFKLTTPYGKEDHPTEVRQPGLRRYADGRCFFVRQGGVVFRVRADGFTTSGSDYPRCELREMELDGDRATWDTRRGRNHMGLTAAVTHVPKGRSLVLAQIHDADDDLVMVKATWVDADTVRLSVEWSKGKNKGSDPEPLRNVQLGEQFVLDVDAADGKVSVALNGKRTKPRSKPKSGCYFKAGVYLQTNTDKDRADVYGEVVIYDLEVSHT